MNPQVITILALLFVSFPAAANMEWVEDSELGNYCGVLLNNPKQPEAAACLTYIQGFLEGADATQGAIAATSAGASREQLSRSNWQDRALLTRIGSRTQRFGNQYGAGFCVPGDIATMDVIQVVARDIHAAAPDASTSTKRIIHRSLLKHFPCSEKN